MKVFVGHDIREQAAYDAAVKTLRSTSSVPVDVNPLVDARLRQTGLLTRPVDTRSGRFDIISGAECATDFSNSRFLVPILCQSGWAVFVDADVIFLDDINLILREADRRFAVQVVKHPPLESSGLKMDGCVQYVYPRKNWSSVILWNCDHPGNARLTLNDVNSRPGRDLHNFYWLHDSEIGELTPRWNWLVGVAAPPPLISIAHFTLGGPFIPGWKIGEGPFDNLWLAHARG